MKIYFKKRIKKVSVLLRLNRMSTNSLWVCALITFVAVSILFSYRTFWVDLNPKSHNVEYLGEIQASEWGLEKIYQKIIHDQSPFSSIREILYPFGVDIVAGDMGTAFYFPILRLFFSTHQAFIFLIIAGPILANIGMFALLLRLKVNKGIALILALAYGHMTFLIPRIGHPTFISSIFLIPWFYLMLTIFFQTKRYKIKFFTSLAASFLLVFTLWQHMYYFLILVFSLIFLSVYWIIFRFKDAVDALKRYWLFGVVNIIFAFILLLPWLKALYKTMLFSETPNPGGWAGAIEFSSDLFGFFIPNIHNYYYGDIIAPILDRIPFTAQGLFENFTYPGIIIIGSFLLLFFYRKKNSPKIHKLLAPFFWTSIGFLVLTLGPFLHILGKWWVEVDEGIRLVLPLPFAVLHYVPFFSNIRAPGRLIVGFIFFAYIVSGFVLTAYTRKKSLRFKAVLFLCLFLIFIFDQRPKQLQTIGKKIPVAPNKIFSTIARDPSPVSVLEIPFVVRDGLSYFGDLDAVALVSAQKLHSKPALGGYTGRIPDYIKAYYVNNPFFGYLGRVIDVKIDSNYSFDKTDLSTWLTTPNIAGSKETIEFLDIKYTFFKENSFSPEELFAKSDLHVASTTAFLQRVGFVKKLKDKNYSLWQYPLEGKEFFDTHIGTSRDDLFLGFGWYPREENFRWMARRSLVMFKVNSQRFVTLHFTAAGFYKENTVNIYVNKAKAGKAVIIPNEFRGYKIKLSIPFKQGINFVHLIFDHKYSPATVMPGNLDARILGAQFNKLYITE